MSAFVQNLGNSNNVLYFPSIKNNQFSREKLVMVNRIHEKKYSEGDQYIKPKIYYVHLKKSVLRKEIIQKIHI